MNASPLHTIGIVARRIDLPRWKLAYLIEKHALPGPSFQVPGRRLFTEEDVLQIEKKLQQEAVLAVKPRQVAAAGSVDTSTN